MNLSADRVRFAEALYRCEAHCEVACELYGAGRPADAVLHAVRPITDTFPWLETELRSHPEQLRNLMVAVSGLSGALRHAVRPRLARRHLRAVAEARRAAIDVVVGPASSSDAFKASVGIALLDTARDRYARGVPEGDLNVYQGVYALVRSGLQLLRSAGAGRVAGEREPMDALDAALQTLEPPQQLLRPDDVALLVDRIAHATAERLGAVRPIRSPADDLRRVEALLSDVVGSYEQGVPALAARLAASLFVRSYDPLRAELRCLDAETEARLAETIGVDLRRAINGGAPRAEVTELADRARTLIGALLESEALRGDHVASRNGA